MQDKDTPSRYFLGLVEDLNCKVHECSQDVIIQLLTTNSIYQGLKDTADVIEHDLMLLIVHVWEYFIWVLDIVVYLRIQVFQKLVQLLIESLVIT